MTTEENLQSLHILCLKQKHTCIPTTSISSINIGYKPCNIAWGVHRKCTNHTMYLMSATGAVCDTIKARLL